MYPNKPTNASRCAADRREREDSAPRLADRVPRLATLSIWIDEGSIVTSPSYVRRIVVKSAPALFVLPCSDQNCSDGGHDISSEVLGALAQERRAFSGTHACDGWIGNSRCQRTIRFRCEAEYVAGADTSPR